MRCSGSGGSSTAAWVGRLLQECLRARTHEAELLEQQALHGSAKADQEISDAQLAQITLDAAEWLRTLWEVGYMGAGNFPAPVLAQESAIQLLTVHGAKGLEAEQVIIIDSLPAAERSPSYGVLSDWPAHASTPEKLVFFRSGKTHPQAGTDFQIEK